MKSYEVVAPPGTDLKESGAEQILDGIARWVCSEPLRDLVAAFGGPLPESNRLRLADLDRLLAFSAQTWDFRRGVERHEAIGPRYDGTRTGDLILAAATALGMVDGTEPAYRSYDHVLILGSLLQACLVRSRFAADLIREQDLWAGELSGLGSSRLATPSEVELARRLERDRHCQLGTVRTEADAMAVAMRLELGLGQVLEEKRGGRDGDPNHSWWVRTYWLDGERRMRVLCVPSGDPARRRANTADTYRFWAERTAPLRPMTTILVVTSSIFVPFQAADALRILALPWGCQVEVVGVDHRRPYDGVPAPWPTSYYLQEIHSALRSMRDLYQEVVDRHEQK